MGIGLCRQWLNRKLHSCVTFKTQISISLSVNNDLRGTLRPDPGPVFMLVPTEELPLMTLIPAIT